MEGRKQLLKYSDVAEQLKVSVRTVTRMVADGLTIVKLRDRVYRVEQSDLDLFIRRSRRSVCQSISTKGRSVGVSRFSEGTSVYIDMLNKAQQKKKLSSMKAGHNEAAQKLYAMQDKMRRKKKQISKK